MQPEPAAKPAKRRKSQAKPAGAEDGGGPMQLPLQLKNSLTGAWGRAGMAAWTAALAGMPAGCAPSHLAFGLYPTARLLACLTERACNPSPSLPPAVLALGEVEWLHPAFHHEKAIYPVGYRARRTARELGSAAGLCVKGGLPRAPRRT